MSVLIVRRPPLVAFIAGTAVFLVLLFSYLHQSGHQRLESATQYFKPRAGSGQKGLVADVYNNTLGFEKIFVVGLPQRTDRRDGIVLGMALDNIDFEFIDGVKGQDVPDNAIPTSPNHERLPDAAVGSWRAHMDAIKEVVRRNLSSALIMEDDVDWDVRLRDQLHNFARASHALTQPLEGYYDTYADQTYPAPQPDSPETLPDMLYDKLPSTHAPKFSPYGDHWDLLWLGHCRMKFVWPANKRTPRGRVVQPADPTVPQPHHLESLAQPDDLKLLYPNHTRVTHHHQDGLCSLAYAVTRRGARELLYEVGLKDFKDPFDVALKDYCEGVRGHRYHTCLSTQPSLFHHHRPIAPKKYHSDISFHGEEWEEKAFTPVVRWSLRLNVETMLDEKNIFVDQYPDDFVVDLYVDNSFDNDDNDNNNNIDLFIKFDLNSDIDCRFKYDFYNWDVYSFGECNNKWERNFQSASSEHVGIGVISILAASALSITFCYLRRRRKASADAMKDTPPRPPRPESLKFKELDGWPVQPRQSRAYEMEDNIAKAPKELHGESRGPGELDGTSLGPRELSGGYFWTYPKGVAELP